MKYYIDTSTLFGLYVPETHTKKILTFFENKNKELLISRLTEVEFYSALATKVRTKSIRPQSIKKITELFNSHIHHQHLQKLYVTDEVFLNAMSYLQKIATPLRTLDALHLACAELNHATLITSDKLFFNSAQLLKIPAEFI